MLSLHEQLKEGAMLLRGFATADASSLIEEAAFFEDLFLSNGRFDAGNHFYDNAVIRPSDLHFPNSGLSCAICAVRLNLGLRRSNISRG